MHWGKGSSKGLTSFSAVRRAVCSAPPQIFPGFFATHSLTRAGTSFGNVIDQAVTKSTAARCARLTLRRELVRASKESESSARKRLTREQLQLENEDRKNVRGSEPQRPLVGRGAVRAPILLFRRGYMYYFFMTNRERRHSLDFGRSTVFRAWSDM